MTDVDLRLANARRGVAVPGGTGSAIRPILNDDLFVIFIISIH